MNRHQSSGEEAQQPPQPPPARPRIALQRKQLIGFPLFLAVPVLALFGMFGARHASVHAASAFVDLRVSYPTRFRYRQLQPLNVSVRNLSDRVLDTISVSFDTAYMSRFVSVKVEPVTVGAYTVNLLGVKPSESRLVSVELWGQDYGRHRGRVVARDGADSAIASFTTTVFP